MDATVLFSLWPRLSHDCTELLKPFINRQIKDLLYWLCWLILIINGKKSPWFTLGWRRDSIEASRFSRLPVNTFVHRNKLTKHRNQQVHKWLRHFRNKSPGHIIVTSWSSGWGQNMKCLMNRWRHRKWLCGQLQERKKKKNGIAISVFSLALL